MTTWTLPGLLSGVTWNIFYFSSRHFIPPIGWSYGGFATAMTLEQDIGDNEVFKCGISGISFVCWFWDYWTDISLWSCSSEFMVVVRQYLHWAIHGSPNHWGQRRRIQPQSYHLRVCAYSDPAVFTVNILLQNWKSGQEEVDAESWSCRWQRPLPTLHAAD